MKAITIKQPWASLIVHGIKDIENRSWRTNFRGRVLIHTATDKKLMNIPPSEFMTPEQIEAYYDNFFYFPMLERNLYSVIIGSVEIVDCVINHPSIWAEETENYTIGMNPKIYENITGKKVVYNWVLANPILFPKPIPAKGKLSLWEYDRILEPVSDGDHKICMCRICVDEKVQVMSMGTYFVCKYCGGRWYK
ncbi:ASCH domain-containing protein [Bacteroides timonensis]|uniref:ASCH domain-containing protein n=1 Tax=Bacteroides timonensis TaxID=1470345 RepID=UPI0004B827E2|nr:ASCH domain-containing protein [Bacteroides timonensis]